MTDTEYPVIESDGEELSFPNAWRADIPQTLGDVDCFNPDAQPNQLENLIVMRLTGQQLLEMFSALYIGAEFCYPEKYLEVIRPLLAATSCPPDLDEQDCVDYPSYAPFFSYSPMNPHTNPNFIPDGYVTAPFIANTADGVPIPNYLDNDVLVPFSALTLDANWFEDISETVPTIKIHVQNTGSVAIRLLNQVQGGLAVVTLDYSPNLADILAGIVLGSDNIIDLNMDIASIPPENAQEIIYQVPIETAGMHTIYVSFLPVVDDSLIPLRFGGGFRGATLCDTVPQGASTVNALRFDNCNLEYQDSDGNWQVVEGWEDWLTCLPPSGGGGGGGAANLLVTTYGLDLNTNRTKTGSTYESAGIPQTNHVFTKPNAIIQATCQVQNTSAGNRTTLRLQLIGTPPAILGDFQTEAFQEGNTARHVTVSDHFTNIPQVSTDIDFEWKVSAGTGTMLEASSVNILVIEYENAEDLFVQDIRIQNREIQKKIGGVWLTVSDSLDAILDALDSQIATINNTLTTHQQQIIGVQNVNAQQTTQLNDHEARLDSLETIDIPQINFVLGQHTDSIADHETRITVLENAPNEESTWGVDPIFLHIVTGAELAPANGWSSPNGNNYGSAALGWRSNTNGIIIQKTLTQAQAGSLAFIRVHLTDGQAMQRHVYVNSDEQQIVTELGLGNPSWALTKLENRQDTILTISVNYGGAYTEFGLVQLRLYGIGIEDPF